MMAKEEPEECGSTLLDSLGRRLPDIGKNLAEEALRIPSRTPEIVGVVRAVLKTLGQVARQKLSPAGWLVGFLPLSWKF